MRLGVDQYTLHHMIGVPGGLTGIAVLELIHARGLAGIQFGDIRQVSPTLDGGELRAARDWARAHGLYLELGIPCPNPYRPGQLLIQDGDGDFRHGLRRHLPLIAEALEGTRSVRCFVGGPGDRHEGAAPFPDQIRETIAVLREFVPLLRDLGLKLAFENHADATTDELIGVVEALGTDVAGLNLDTGNLMILLEDPLPATRRAAPYTIATHLKDGIVVFADDGLTYNARPLGEGSLPVADILAELARHQPDLTLSIEDHGRFFPMPIYRDAFLSTFPSLSPIDLAGWVRTARLTEQRIAAGELASPEVIEAVPWEDRALDRLERGRRFAASTLETLLTPA